MKMKGDEINNIEELMSKKNLKINGNFHDEETKPNEELEEEKQREERLIAKQMTDVTEENFLTRLELYSKYNIMTIPLKTMKKILKTDSNHSSRYSTEFKKKPVDNYYYPLKYERTVTPYRNRKKCAKCNEECRKYPPYMIGSTIHKTKKSNYFESSYETDSEYCEMIQTIFDTCCFSCAINIFQKPNNKINHHYEHTTQEKKLEELKSIETNIKKIDEIKSQSISNGGHSNKIIEVNERNIYIDSLMNLIQKIENSQTPTLNHSVEYRECKDHEFTIKDHIELPFDIIDYLNYINFERYYFRLEHDGESIIVYSYIPFAYEVNYRSRDIFKRAVKYSKTFEIEPFDISPVFLSASSEGFPSLTEKLSKHNYTYQYQAPNYRSRINRKGESTSQKKTRNDCVYTKHVLFENPICGSKIVPEIFVVRHQYDYEMIINKGIYFKKNKEKEDNRIKMELIAQQRKEEYRLEQLENQRIKEVEDRYQILINEQRQKERLEFERYQKYLKQKELEQRQEIKSIFDSSYSDSKNKSKSKKNPWKKLSQKDRKKYINRINDDN
jgi:hypothetical protein